MRTALVWAAAVLLGCGTTTAPAGGGSGSGGGGSGGGGSDASSSGGGGGSDSGSGGGGSDGGASGGGTDGGTIASGLEILTSGENATGLAIDADNVYWLNTNSHGSVDVRSMPKSGDAPATLASTQSSFAGAIVAPGNGAVWTANDCSLPCDYPGAGLEWALYTSAPGGFRMLAPIRTFAIPAADGAAAYSRSFDQLTGRWDLLACARDGSGCGAVRGITDRPLASPVYLDSGRLFWIEQPTDTDLGSRSHLFWNDPATMASGGQLLLQNVVGVLGLRVNGDVFALRAFSGNVWTGTLATGGELIWNAQSGLDVDVNGGRVYWSQSPTRQYPGCLGSANLDGTDGKCLDEGQRGYGTVRVDDRNVFFIRDGQIARMPRQ
jgi:hypothetical protein